MATAKAYSAKDGALWIQPLGPNTPTHFLGCFDLGDIDEPLGDPDLIQCWSADCCGADTLGEVAKPPEKVKSSLATILTKTANYVERLCDGNQGKISLYALTRSGGTPKLFTNRVRASTLHNVRLTSHKRSNLIKRIENAAGAVDWDVVAWPPVYDTFAIKAVRDSNIAETLDLNAVALLKSCDECDCNTRWAAADAAGGAKAKVWYKDTTVTAWTSTAAQPFANAENIAFIALLPMTVDTYSVLVGRGTTDAGNPAEVSYSDDKGVTWTPANVGTVNGAFFVGKKSVFALDYHNVWVCDTDGYIYYSNDGGLTWTAQLSAGAGKLNAVHFSDDSIGITVGDANTVIYTYDGGTAWDVATGPASKAGVDINACWCTDIDRLWLLYEDGDLWYTMDGGETWYERAVEGVTATEMVDISFVSCNDHVAFLLLRKGSYLLDRAEIYRTIDGGLSWELTDPPSNEGLNAIVACNVNRAVAVGQTYLGRTMVVDVYNP